MKARCRLTATPAVVFLLATAAGAQAPPVLTQLVPGSLKTIQVPEPTDLDRFVRDRDAAVVLGKALFWDMQVGSDGIQACATCHFHAGADSRRKNQLHPGPNGAFEVGTGPNHTLTAADFPFHRLSDPLDNESPLLSETDDVSGSQGVHDAAFLDVTDGQDADDCEDVVDEVFTLSGANTRRVTGRNTPSAINAVFNVRSFWDGRASFYFNGVDPVGLRNPNARVLEKQASGAVVPVSVLIDFASLASQATGPPLSDVEMSCAGRVFPKLGKKMLALTPLAKQVVSPTDSALAAYANSTIEPGATGLSISYPELIEAAFKPRWWSSDAVITFDGSGHHVVSPPTGAPLTSDQYSMMEANFSLFWGLAIQMYESTLVSDDTPFDRYQDGGGEFGSNPDALTAQQKTGLAFFFSTATNCAVCHLGPEFSSTTISNINRPEIFDPDENPVVERLIEQMPMSNGLLKFYDTGFYNIGVRPTEEDLGVGGNAAGPICFARRAALGLPNPEQLQLVDDPLIPFVGAPVACDGAFKTPMLRNVELTPPYFHNGGENTLEDVVAFYNRRGNFPVHNADNLSPAILFLGLTQQAQKAIVAFLRSLTDERVRFREAPFDHPEFFVPVGHPDEAAALIASGEVEASSLFVQGTDRDLAPLGAYEGDPLVALVETGGPERAADLLMRIRPTGAEGHCIGIDGTPKGDAAFESTSCDDQDACTLDLCDPAVECMHLSVSCDDGNACTVDSCDALAGCLHEPLVCDDGNPCTDDTCDALAGCLATPNSAPCDDGNACTSDDACDGVTGACAGGPLVDCGDGDVCTVDFCDVAAGCEHQSNGLCEGLVCVSASDASATLQGNMTTSILYAGGTDADANADSLSSRLLYAASALAAPNGGSGDQATYELVLPSAGNWVAWGRFYYPGLPGSNDANSFLLRVDAGAPKKFGNNKNYFRRFHWDGEGNIETGPLVGLPLGTLAAGTHHVVVEKREVIPVGMQPRLDMLCLSKSLDEPPLDADALAVASVHACSQAVDCNDANPCTDDVCGPSGLCSYPSNAAACDDGLYCNGADTCNSGSCSLHAGDPCAGGAACSDQCDEAADVCASPNGAPCDDGIACTGDDRCSEGFCTGADACAGGSQCNTSSGQCEEILCASDSDCDDADVCNGQETCQAGHCVVGIAPDCDDLDACTDDICDPSDGCSHVPATCDDGDACTDDACDSVAGCSHAPVVCDDALGCTADACIAGHCVFADQCPAGSACDAPSGLCQLTSDLVCIAAGADPTAAFSGAMTTDGQFTAGADLDPNADSLTSALVHAASTVNSLGGGSGDQVGYRVVLPETDAWTLWGRFYYPSAPGSNGPNSFHVQVDGGPLKKLGNNKDFHQRWHWDGDGALETGPGVGLALGVLAAGEHAIVVEKREVVPDGQQPRLDVLCFAKGAAEKPSDAEVLAALGHRLCLDDSHCADGAACGDDGVCAIAATCASDTDCDDGNACTNDSCDLAAGTCSHAAVVCDDGNACTQDSCDVVDGSCTSAALVCDDGDACNGHETCDPFSGCSSGVAVDCDDGDACTEDLCDQATGACSSQPRSCDDGSQCTADTCDPDSGCAHEAVACPSGQQCIPATGACEAQTVCFAAADPSVVLGGAMALDATFAGGADLDPALDSLTSPLLFANSVTNAFSGGSGDQASYTVVVPEAAEWFAWARMYYPSAPDSNGPNSFLLSVDGGAARKLGNNKGFHQRWHWDGDGTVEIGPPTSLPLGTLAAGQHTIVVEKREVTPAGQQPRLDVLCLTKNGSTPPADASVVLAGGGS